MPLQGNRVEIEIKVKGSTTAASPITGDSPVYKVTKETAYQLGLKFEGEEQ